ncbi:MAG: 4-hydroxyphenylacetate 3-monooxygenase, oxygenase component [Betaproteobacteria bacterium]|nr:4-hydroxyphenylacetate 3-monooxygenase, oxygenase component [Betaproteobacteria bacterium]
MSVRNGDQYLAGLLDTREVWCSGERVADVTTHPLLGRTARSIARLYDLQCAPDARDVLTYVSPDSDDRCSLAYSQPRSAEDVARRGRMFYRWSQESLGFFGRSPDYPNTLLTGFAMAAPFFAQNGPDYAKRLTAYYEWCRTHDVCLTHSLVDPQVNRARGQSEQRDLGVALSIVGENAAGLIVSGARMLATLAPFADELLVFPSPSRARPTDAERYAFAFAIPLATPGLRIICRPSLDAAGPVADHPLSSRYEEMDAVIVCNEVLVPWERVFLKGNVELCNRASRDTSAFVHGIHQSTVKSLVKAETVLGVATLLADAIGRTELSAYQQMLAEIVDAVVTLRAYLRTAEVDAVRDAYGFYAPNPEVMFTARNYFPKIYPRLIEILQLVGSSGLMAIPDEADLNRPELAADIDRYFQSANLMGHERVRLFRLAWDLCGSAFAGRQVLYERFFAGDPQGLNAARFGAFDQQSIAARVRAFLAR